MEVSDDDIVTVLRSFDDGRVGTHAPDCWTYHQRCALLVAADEIDRLNLIVTGLKAAIKEYQL